MKKQMPQRPKSKSWLRIILGIVGVIIGILVAGLLYVNKLMGKINYVDKGEVVTTGTFIALEDNRLDGANKKLADLADGDVLHDDAVTNILLIGTDNRTPGAHANSDTMILFSYNRDTKKMWLSSFMRDMYVTIPEVGNHRMNHATMVGGPELLLKTVEQNFKVKVDDYVMVDFYSFAKIVDILGGVPMEVSGIERDYINYSVQRMNEAEGRPTNSGLLSGSGQVHLSGSQAVGYSRIRAVGNADYERTSRQRKVINALIDEMREASVGEMMQILDEVLPYVTTNMDKKQLISLVMEAPGMMDCPLEQLRLPEDGAFSSVRIDGMSVLLPEYEENIIYLQEAIYERNNVSSSTLKE